MPARTSAMLVMCAALICAVALHTQTALAQYQAFELPNPGTGPQRHDQQLTLAGPVAEAISGSVVVTLAPMLGAVVTLTTGPGLLGCWGDTDPQCEREYQEKSRQAAVNGAAVGISIGLVGIVLLAHGAYRIRRVGKARRDARRPSAWNLEASPQRTSMTLRWSF